MNETVLFQNGTNSTLGASPMTRYYKESLGLKVFKLTLQITVGLIGVIGNLLVCVVIASRSNMKTKMNILLCSLAVADTGVLLINFPLAAIQEQLPLQYPFGRWFCLYLGPATEIFFGASIWSITIIAIERNRNIVRRSKSECKGLPCKGVIWKIILLWFASLLIVSVPLYPIMVYQEFPQVTICYPEWPDYREGNIYMKAYTIGLAIFWYLLPLVIITYTYIQISQQLQKSTAFHKNMHGASAKSKLIIKEEKQRLKQNKKAQMILTPLVVVFAISMLPLNVFRLVQAFYPSFVFYKFYLILLSVCAVFVIANSAMEPVVYYIASREFCQGIRNLLRRKKAERRKQKEESTSPKNYQQPILMLHTPR
ncbi:predicted protein [Nematostella vectensis]|uniref:G-protein coupled receptors family 1 profile domain-containing protein n=1 Tax=Nematostella vectensis TaxID=45351 RepID=A7RYJ5_NEMVE|nr:predicted protein [Nematostella vectensis]|eukprot:XP_001635535.1 predicted protein [Nematostella vectensis]